MTPSTWRKNHSGAAKRVGKEVKKAVDTAVLNAETEKRLLEEGKAKKAAALELLKAQNSNKGETTVNLTQIQSLIASTMTEMFQQNRERELHMQIRLQEARNEEIKMRQNRTTLEQDTVAQLQLFQQQMATMEDRIVNRITGDMLRLKELEVRSKELDLYSKIMSLESKVEAHLKGEEAVAEEQPQPKKRGRKAKVNPDIKAIRNKVEEVRNPLEGKVEEVIEHPLQGLHTPLRRGMRGLTIDWKALDRMGLFETVLVDIVLYAQENEVDIYKASKFQRSSKTANGAYQQFGLRNKGIRTWEEFINQHFGTLV